VIAVAIVGVSVLSPYGGRTQAPLSYDTPYYVWRTTAVMEGGLDVLTRIPTGAVPNPHRPGFPVLGSLLRTVTGTDALTFSVIVRALAAVAIGLAAAAMAREALRDPPWATPAFVVGLGLSAAVLGTAVENLEQLVADIFLVALAATVPLVASGKRGWVAAGAFFASAALTHWLFTVLFLIVLLGAGVVSTLLRWRTEREGWWRGSSARILKLVGLLALVAAVVVLLLPSPPSRLPSFLQTSGNELPGNVRRLGAYELPLVLSLAGVGVLLGFWRSDDRKRTTMILLGLWAATLPTAIVVSTILPREMKLFRVAPFAVGAPLLAVVALVALVRIGTDRLGRVGAVVGSILLLVGLAFLVGTPAATFEAPSGPFVSGRVAQGRIAGRYLAAVAEPTQPVIFLTQAAPRLVDRAVRAGVPPSLVEDTWVYVGTAEDLDARAPVDDPARRSLSRVSRRWWRSAWPHPADVFDRDPIVIALARPVGPVPETPTDLAPGVSVIRGPAPPALDPVPRFRFEWADILVATALCLVVLAAVGLGWALALLEVTASSAVALAPASGAAALILGGLAADRLGISLDGPAGVGVTSVMALAGWALLVVRRRALADTEVPTGGG
jgi:MFS family permease